MPQKCSRRADENILHSLAVGATIENAARQAGVSERTVNRRLEDPAFRAKLQAYRNSMLERTAATINAAGHEAAKRLLKLLGDGNPPAIQLGAAKALLDVGGKLRTETELINRIAALEQQVATGAV